MTQPTIGIIGASGTVGLRLQQRLSELSGVKIVTASARETDLSRFDVDLAVLCLPANVAAMTAAVLPHATRILDCSAAHRGHPDWVYGLPELDLNQPERIRAARCVSNPGCYATGAILLLAPLRDVLVDYPVVISAVGGYTAGGSRLMKEQASAPMANRLYGLDLNHRHVAEIEHVANLKRTPLLLPSVGNYPQGTLVSIALDTDMLPVTRAQIEERLRAAYAGTAIAVHGRTDSQYVAADGLAGTDACELFILPGARINQALLVARYDNLGKGAAGAALMNVSLMLGVG